MARYKKGPMGHYMDMRAAMIRAHTAMGEAIKALDAGDVQALQDLSTVTAEALGDFSTAAKAFAPPDSE
jgi:hypothetical protein